MAKHKNYCPGYNGTPDELATEITAMTHEAQAELYDRLYTKKVKQRRREESLGREKYVRQLRVAEEGLKTLIDGELGSWEICKKHTEVEKRKP